MFGQQLTTGSAAYTAFDMPHPELQSRMVLQVKKKQQEEAAARDAEASAKAEARIKAALEANRSIILKRRQDYDTKQVENEERRM